MAESKKIVVNIPKNLLNEIDGIVSFENKKNRNECIKEAMCFYIKEKKKDQLREYMKTGYQEMADINLEFSELGIEGYSSELYNYEVKLTGCD